MQTVIIGGGRAGRAAAARLPGATLLSRPDTTVFHAEPSGGEWRLWLTRPDGIDRCEAARIVLAAPDLQMAPACGCAGAQLRPVLDRRRRTRFARVLAPRP